MMLFQLDYLFWGEITVISKFPVLYGCIYELLAFMMPKGILCNYVSNVGSRPTPSWRGAPEYKNIINFATSNAQ